MRKSDLTRPYPPDFCSVATLAYRLDCSPRAVHEYASSGLLPKPMLIGNMKRWLWRDVFEHIEAANPHLLATGDVGAIAAGDEYSADIIKLRATRRTTEKAGDGGAA